MPNPGDATGGSADGTQIRVIVGDTTTTGRLHDNPTARDLAAQLPLTLDFRDLNHVEKTAPLPRRLSLDGAPDGHAPAAGEIGYWSPGGDLVLYYGDVRFWNGIVPIGQLDGELDTIARQRDDFRATIEQETP